MSPSPSLKWIQRSGFALTLAVLLYPAPSPLVSRSPASSISGCQDLFATFCEANDVPVSTDPTGEVWDEREAQNGVQKLRATLTPQTLISRIYSPLRVQQIRKTEKWVRQELYRWIDQHMGSALNPRDALELRQRIKAVSLEIPEGSEKPSEILLEHGAFYETQKGPGSNQSRIRLGGAYVLGTSSKANWVFTLAHEFAHSIDPCELRASGWTPPALERLNGCLLQKGVIQTPNDRHECLRRDQLSEVFADWLATEILVAWLEHYGKEYPSPQRWALVRNSVRDLCPPPEGDYDSEWHPQVRTRINRILGENSKIRTYLGCSPSDQKTCRTGDQ